jgi:hypothetical protein
MKLKKGDRVVTYSGPSRFCGRVIGVTDKGFVEVTLDHSSGFVLYHPKQCRKLIKRRRIWVDEDDIIYYMPRPDCKEFIEARKKPPEKASDITVRFCGGDDEPFFEKPF